jgi:phosphopantothenoylcysteine decarboxylase/phosphopantothenate--cysteine ligase
VAKSSLKGREIVLGVSGSIAAYKAAELVRLFREQGAGVSCVMTEGATRFITPLTLSALSARPVAQDMFDQSLWNMAHLRLAKDADAVVVAPASADLLSRLAAGRADDLLSALILSTRRPVFLAPAMHEPMWTHPATRKNVSACRSHGYRLIGPVKGPLASGDTGWGRLEEPSRIVAHVAAALAKPGPPGR